MFYNFLTHKGAGPLQTLHSKWKVLPIRLGQRELPFGCY